MHRLRNIALHLVFVQQKRNEDTEKSIEYLSPVVCVYATPRVSMQHLLCTSIQRWKGHCYPSLRLIWVRPWRVYYLHYLFSLPLVFKSCSAIAFAITLILLHSSTANRSASTRGTIRERTTWNQNPEKVHQKVVDPEIITLGSTVCNASDVVIVQARAVIQRISINVASRYESLKRVTQWRLRDHEINREERQRTPNEYGHGLHTDDKGIL